MRIVLIRPSKVISDECCLASCWEELKIIRTSSNNRLLAVFGSAICNRLQSTLVR